jgi:hypothetical protein
LASIRQERVGAVDAVSAAVVAGLLLFYAMKGFGVKIEKWLPSVLIQGFSKIWGLFL